MKKNRALLIVHQGSPSIKRMVDACRQCGPEPLVISNAPPSLPAKEGFEAICRELGVEFRIFDTSALMEADCLASVGARVNEFAFALALWDGQRRLMARMNEVFSAPDLSEKAVLSIQDKLRFRRLLAAHGLTKLRAATAQEFLTSGTARLEPGPWIAKPRRGLGSVCTRVARSEADVREILTKFTAGPVSADIFTEIYTDNELIVEDYFEGHEFSLELLMQSGQCYYLCDHEKTRLTNTSQTILEHAFASPSVALDQSTLARARALVLRSFELLDLHSGWFHVELRVNAAGELEFVEINPRSGGGLIPESIRRQSGRTPLLEWCQLLLGNRITPASERRCGTYQQIAYAKSSSPIQCLVRSTMVRHPDVLQEMKKPGDVCQMDREDIVALMLWETPLDLHAEHVATLSSVDFIDVVTSENIA